MNDSPASSAPSTPNDDAQGHKRNDSVAIGTEDYFMAALRLRQDTKSSTLKRNATFSPRIVFYDTWPSQEYDRRGEIATCNRLTPILAQQIKEELNSFKMVSLTCCLAATAFCADRVGPIGDGGSRKLKGLHALLLMTTTVKTRMSSALIFVSRRGVFSCFWEVPHSCIHNIYKGVLGQHSMVSTGVSSMCSV